MAAAGDEGPARPEDWRQAGVRVVPHDRLDDNTPQTPGMQRRSAISGASAGANSIWAGTVSISPGARTGPHHHGELESVIYVLRGHARLRWGERLEFVADAGAGDFIYVPAFVPHQEINADPDGELDCVLARSGQEAIVVNLIVDAVDDPEEITWVDPHHPAPG